MKDTEHDDPRRAVAPLGQPVEQVVSRPGVLRPSEVNGAPYAEQVQVDVGGYQIFQGDASGPLIAELYVEEDPDDDSNEKVLIEHWGLYPREGWVTPSKTNPSPPPLALRRVNGIWGSSGDFRRHLRGKPNVTYVQARCETMDP